MDNYMGYQRLNTGLTNKASAQSIYADENDDDVKNLTTLHQIVIPKLEQGDSLVVTDLAQLGDTVSDALNIIVPLLKRDIRIDVANIGMIDNTGRGFWITKTLLGVARQEKDIRRFNSVQKTKNTKHTSRGGRPRRKLTPKYKAALIYLNNHTYRQTVDKFNISKSTLKRIKKQFGKAQRRENYKIQSLTYLKIDK